MLLVEIWISSCQEVVVVHQSSFDHSSAEGRFDFQVPVAVSGCVDGGDVVISTALVQSFCQADPASVAVESLLVFLLV